LGTTPEVQAERKVDYKAKLKAFVKLIRTRHPDTWIYITCSIYSDANDTGAELRARELNIEAVNELATEGFNTSRVKVHVFTPISQGAAGGTEYGANWHPGVKGNKRLGRAIAEAIATDLGWDIMNN